LAASACGSKNEELCKLKIDNDEAIKLAFSYVGVRRIDDNLLVSRSGFPVVVDAKRCCKISSYRVSHWTQFLFKNYNKTYDEIQINWIEIQSQQIPKYAKITIDRCGRINDYIGE